MWRSHGSMKESLAYTADMFFYCTLIMQMNLFRKVNNSKRIDIFIKSITILSRLQLSLYLFVENTAVFTVTGSRHERAAIACELGENIAISEN